MQPIRQPADSQAAPTPILTLPNATSEEDIVGDAMDIGKSAFIRRRNAFKPLTLLTIRIYRVDGLEQVPPKPLQSLGL